MRSVTRIRMALAVLALAAACTDTPLAPSRPPGATPPATAPEGVSARDRQERLARQFALALNSPQLRQALLAELQQSPSAEKKVHFQALLAGNGGRFRRALAEAGGVPEEAISADALAAASLETYLPVPEHRARWRGADDLLVATAVADGDTPVAFDTRGRRRQLDPARPPDQPVLALVPAEQPFEGLYPSTGFCPPEGCDSGTLAPSTGGLYMTYASFTQTFESWLKGNPEFEVHILGQDGSGSTLKSYQCAGEHAGGPYAFDQNAKTWSGSVMLFSQNQFDAFQASHPGQAVRVLVVEDDDGACVIKTDKDQLSNLFKALDAAYQLWTGGKADLLNLTKLFKRATMLQQLYTATAALITTNDDIVGNAIDDDIVGQTWSGTNWIVKGSGNITNGGIRLEMR
jgi:hypothetical protein